MSVSVSDVKKIQEIVTDFLAKLSVSAKAHVLAVEEYVKIEISGKDSSLLIGFHGDNLRSLRHLLSIIIKNQISDEVVIMVDVEDYLARKEERIKEIARKAIEKLNKTGKPQDLPAMNPYERRIIHSFLSDEGYNSESAGVGYDRHIVVKK